MAQALALVLCAVALLNSCFAQLSATQEPAAKLPAGRVAPAKATGKKAMRRLPPVSVSCNSFAQNPPFRVVNCKFISRLAVPVCAKFSCSPPPGGACPAMGGTGAVSNKACSWAITENCTLPTPVYPTRGNTYGFGWITEDPGPVQVSIASFTRVGFRGIACPTV